MQDRILHRLRGFVALTVMAILAACSGPGEKARQGDNEPAGLVANAAPSAVAGEGAIEIGALQPRELAAGQCAMFLWAKQSRARFVFHARSQGEAVMVLNGKERVFTRTAADGNPAFGQFTKQKFRAEEWALALTVDVQARKGMVGGAVIPRGALRVRAREGWTRVLPVAGLIACKSE